MFGNNDVNSHKRLLVLFGHDFAFGDSSGSHHMTPLSKENSNSIGHQCRTAVYNDSMCPASISLYILYMPSIREWSVVTMDRD